MSAHCEVTVIVPSYEMRERIDACLDSLIGQGLGAGVQIVVVESGRDGTSAHIAQRFPEVDLIATDTRLSPAAARNRGGERAYGSLVNDVHVGELQTC